MSQFDLSLLDYIGADDYTTWVSVGMALKLEGFSVSVWDNWSRRSTKYRSGDCDRKWDSFNGSAAPVTAGTLVQWAKEGGWAPPTGEALDWDAAISADQNIIDTAYLEPEEIRTPADKDWNQAAEIRDYLQALFRHDEYVGYLTDTWEKDGKWVPASGGNYDRTAGQLIDALNRCNGDIGSVFGDTKPDAGAWIRFNPLDGKGVKNDNVIEYRYALVESDSVEPETQLAIIRALELPCAAIVHSGNKSIHAIVRIDAGTDKAEYRKRVEHLYATLKKNGLECDEQNKNPSRLSRMPGILRGGKKQYLISVNEGKKNWAEWVDWCEDETDTLPDFCKVPEDEPQERPALIQGLLREGDKMMLSGPSKAGKSFALIELSIAISRGIPWLGWQCAEGRVLYVNLELQADSCLRRFYELGRGKGENLDIWNLRGEAITLKELLPKLIRRTRGRGYKAIVLDPIYKIMGGDENNAEQVSRFCNSLDKICKQTGAAVIYCHHHSKGAQGGKSAIDRASGSGVFARDADTLLDMIQLRLAGGEETFCGMQPGATAWRMESILRDFPSVPAKNLWFDYPRHKLDISGKLDTAKPDMGQSWTADALNERRQEKAENRKQSALAAFERLEAESKTGLVELQAIVNILGVSPATAAGYFNKEEFTIEGSAGCARNKDGEYQTKAKIIRNRQN